jgi:hypothetical protein
VDPSTAKKTNFFSKVFTLDWGCQVVLCCDFLLVGVLTIEQKKEQESLFRIPSTQIPTVKFAKKL